MLVHMMLLHRSFKLSPFVEFVFLFAILVVWFPLFYIQITYVFFWITQSAFYSFWCFCLFVVVFFFHLSNYSLQLWLVLFKIFSSLLKFSLCLSIPYSVRIFITTILSSLYDKFIVCFSSIFFSFLSFTDTVDLQCCDNFCCTTKLYMYTHLFSFNSFPT